MPGHADVLNRMTLPCRVRRLKIKWPEVNGVVSIIVVAVKCNSHKALPLLILSPDVDLDGTRSKGNVLKPYQSVALLLIKGYPRPATVFKRRHGPVDHRAIPIWLKIRQV